MAMAAPLAADAAAGGAASAEGASAGTLRTPRTGGGAMALDRANRPPAAKRAPVKRAAAATPAEAAEESAPAEESEEEPRARGPRRSLPNPGGVVREGSWIVLGFLGWVWVALPFIKRGPSGVGEVLAAKFINRTPGGK